MARLVLNSCPQMIHTPQPPKMLRLHVSHCTQPDFEPSWSGSGVYYYTFAAVFEDWKGTCHGRKLRTSEIMLTQGKEILQFPGAFPSWLLTGLHAHHILPTLVLHGVEEQWAVFSPQPSPNSSVSNHRPPETKSFSSPNLSSLPILSSNGTFLAPHPTE